MQEAILCVDDDVTVLATVRNLLAQQVDQHLLIEVAESGDEALDVIHELQQEGIMLSVVISDYIMPGMRGDQLLISVHKLAPQTLKIMLTGQSDLKGVKRAINEANLYRFLEKPFNNADLLMTVQSARKAFHQERTLQQQHAELQRLNAELEQRVALRTSELQLKNEELERISSTDRLTGLCNRLRLDRALSEEVARSQRYATQFCLILLDIDKFKSVNDEFGHLAGDRLLQEIARVLDDNIRTTDILGRWGGEEFLIICPQTTLEAGYLVAEKLRIAIADSHFQELGHRSASFGVAAYAAGEMVDHTLRRADRALYRAKECGRNRTEQEHA